MPYKIAALTMCYNEDYFLDLWQHHYGEALGYDCLIVVDHGSESPLKLDPRVNRIRVPRTVLDEREKVRFISDMSKSLLHYFDAVIVSDADELIVVDPQVGKSLPEYIEASPDTVIHPVGLNVIHNRAAERDLVQSGYLFEQRRFVQFDSLYCKPSIIKEPVDYKVGLHRSNKVGMFTSDLILFHLRAMDFALARARYKKFETLKWADADKNLPLSHFWHGFETYAQFVFKMNAPDGVSLTDAFDFRWEVGLMNSLAEQEAEKAAQGHVVDDPQLLELPPETRRCDLVPARFRRTIFLG